MDELELTDKEKSNLFFAAYKFDFISISDDLGKIMWKFDDKILEKIITIFDITHSNGNKNFIAVGNKGGKFSDFIPLEEFDQWYNLRSFW